MRKTEFLQELRACLQGEVSAAVIQENVNYYDSYISQQSAAGRREEDVIEEIGSPRLIAKTIIDSHEAAGTAGAASSGSTGGGYNAGGNEYYSRENMPKVHYINFSKWYWKLLGIVLLIGVLLFGFALASGVLTLVGSLFFLMMRFAGPLLVFWLILQLFRGTRR